MKLIVGFAGYECGDIVLYLAKILSFFGKKTAVLDRTEQRSVLGICGEKEEYAGIRLFASLDEVLESEYDVILKVFGYQPLWEEIRECKELFLVTEGSGFRARLLAGIQTANKSCCMIVRNMVAMKYTEDYLMFLAGQEIDHCFLLFLEERDIKNEYSLGVEKDVPLRQLSESMKELLSEIVLRLDNSIERKQIYLAQKRG